MKPLSRSPVSKVLSAAKFKKNIKKTKMPNVVGPMRGGIRL